MVLKKISKTAYKILLLHVVYISSTILTGSFIHILLWRLRSDLEFIAYYDLMLVTFILIGYIFSAFLLTNFKSDKVLRTAFLLVISSYGLILYFKHEFINHLMLISILNGFGNGIYWGTYNLLKIRETTNQNRVHFFGMIHGIFTIIATILPAIIGFIIVFLPTLTHVELSGYYLLYALSIGLIFILMGYVETIPKFRLKYFKIKDVVEIVNSKSFMNISMYELLAGIFETGSKLVLVIFAYLILKNEFNLGVFSSIFGIFSGLYIYTVGRKIKIKKRSFAVLTGALLIFLGRIVFVKFLNIESLALDRLLEALGSPLFGLPVAAVILSSIENKSKFIIEKEAEYLVASEVPLNIGRFLGSLFFIIFLMTFGGDNLAMIKVWFFIISTLPIIQWYFINRIVKEH